MARIGFVGLGNMGLPMARNLVEAGHVVHGFDLDAAQVEALVASGGRQAADLGEIAGAEVIVTMLPEGRHVRAVCLGEAGIVARAAPGTLLIDCSTIDVATAREVADVAAKAGLDMVDAPVSGGVAGAEAAKLTFMVGGPEAAFARAQPILAAMGARIVHAGGPGNGEAAKICNNMLLAIAMIGTSEAFALARRLGLDDRTFFDIASTSSGQCWSMTSYCPVPGPVPSSPANRDYKPGFAAAMMHKDLRLAKAAVESTGAQAPLGMRAEAFYDEIERAGHGGDDFSIVFRRLAGEI